MREKKNRIDMSITYICLQNHVLCIFLSFFNVDFITNFFFGDATDMMTDGKVNQISLIMNGNHFI